MQRYSAVHTEKKLINFYRKKTGQIRAEKKSSKVFGVVKLLPRKKIYPPRLLGFMGRLDAVLDAVLFSVRINPVARGRIELPTPCFSDRGKPLDLREL